MDLHETGTNSSSSIVPIIIPSTPSRQPNIPIVIEVVEIDPTDEIINEAQSRPRPDSPLAEYLGEVFGTLAKNQYPPSSCTLDESSPQRNCIRIRIPPLSGTDSGFTTAACRRLSRSSSSGSSTLVTEAISLINSDRVIALPEFIFPFSGETLPSVVKEEDTMVVGPMNAIWGCDCPVPGTSPLVVCKECRRRECFEWTWEKGTNDSTAVFDNNDRDVLFNPGFSVGTVAIRGSIPLKQGYHHFWEVEMSTEVYGTDMMVGVGTEQTDLDKHVHNFVSLIGLDSESWGLSYTGKKQHNGKVQTYTNDFGQHTVIGVHLDLWSGCMEFYINRKPVGIAFRGLQGKVLYPMISSTAARSGMNLIFCRSYSPSLQLQTMLSLGKSMLLPNSVSLFKVLPNSVVPPGLRVWMKNNYWWITSNCKPATVQASQREIPTGEKKTDKKRKPTITVTASSTGPSSSSHALRRARKARKDDLSVADQMSATYYYEGVMTRGMAARRPFAAVHGTSPIFAPAPPETSSPSSSSSSNLEVSEGKKPKIIRCSSSPSVREDNPFDDDEIPDRPASSNSNEPGSKRMCLRSSRQ